MSKRRDLRAAIVAATLIGLTAAGLLIRGLDLPGAAEPQDQAEPADRASGLVHQSFQQGVVMLHAKRYELAVRSLHEVLEMRPRMPEAHVNMGFALAGLGEFGAARDFFLSAAELRPSQYNAYYGLAIASEGLGELAAAAGAMRAFLHLAPTDDPFRRRAESAIWEWEAELARVKQQ